MRAQWVGIGVTFNWWCIEVRHFNCLNSLTSDESFIIWDRYKENVWIRKMPKYALTDHPLLKKRKDTYQSFLERISKDGITLIGIRVSESLQRLIYISDKKTKTKQYPIYDWSFNDVWKYIKDNNLSFPKAYIYMYQCGTNMKDLRISQFFSVDTIRSLVKMCEFYPELYDKICKREPNAYMAMLYFDTELFRHSKKNKAQTTEEKNIDYKKKFFDLIKQKEKFTTKSQKTNLKKVLNFIKVNTLRLEERHYKDFYEMLVAGDPKSRTYRSIITNVGTTFNNKNSK